MKKNSYLDFSTCRNLLLGMFILGTLLFTLNPIKAQSTNNITTTIGQYQSSSVSFCAGDTVSIPVTITMANGVGVSAFFFCHQLRHHEVTMC